MRTATALAFAALAGCASAPPSWLDTGEPIPIRWVESDVPSAMVRDGVCELHFADRADGELPHVAALVRQCLLDGGLRWAGQLGVILVRWHQVDSHRQLVELHREANGGDTVTGSNRLGIRRPAGGFFRAFYYEADGICHIVTLRAQSFGHELKHCRDGKYHL